MSAIVDPETDSGPNVRMPPPPFVDEPLEFPAIVLLVIREGSLEK